VLAVPGIAGPRRSRCHSSQATSPRPRTTLRVSPGAVCHSPFAGPPGALALQFRPGPLGLDTRYQAPAKILLVEVGGGAMSTTIRPAAKVLIVHDDEHLQRMMSQALRDYGIEPLSLLRPWRMVEVAADERPDLILLDVEMGYHRGNLIEELKIDQRTRHVPLFMHGRKDTQYDRLLAFELGADDYFGRPIQPELR